MNELTLSEGEQLRQHEVIVERGLATFVEVGEALAAIRDARLYRAEYATFEDYCQQRWGMGKSYAHYMIGAAEVMSNLSTIGGQLPSTERQARPLTGLPPDVQREVWARAVETAPDGKVTAAHVERTILQAAAQIRQERREDRHQERIATFGIAPPLEDQMGQQYDVILADPPWRYEHAMDSGDSIENHYPTMAVEEIMAMSFSIAQIAADDCLLFLWATSPKLAEALQVIHAWGFNYRTNGVWVKNYIGPGYYFRQRHELLLVATHGTPPTPLPAARPDSVQESPRTNHSEKPTLYHDLIEAMYPNARRIELFARQGRQGWTVWGNQVTDAQLP